MNIMSVFYVLLTSALLVASSGLAQETPETAEATQSQETHGSVKDPNSKSKKQKRQFGGEVTVTARKREEVTMDIPASIQVATGTDLEEMNIVEVEDLQWITPGLIVPGGGRAAVAVRGVSNNVVGIGADPSTAVHVDGVYIPRPAMVLSETFDLERVEVMKGPQGTLYGRNATAGVINYITRGPSAAAGNSSVTLDYGSYGLFRADVGIDIPINDRGGFRVSGRYAKDDGYTENIEPGAGDIDNIDFLSFRVKGAYRFSDTVKGTLMVQTVEDDGIVATANNPDTDNLSTLIGPQRTGIRDVSIDPVVSREQRGVVGSLAFDALLGSLSFRSVTGFVNYDDDLLNDNDGTGLWIERGYGTTSSDYFSQEFQLSGGVGNSMFWTTGLYYGNEDVEETAALVDSFDAPGDVLFARFSSNAEAETTAAYAEVGFLLSPQWRLTVGGRYTRDTKKGSAEGEDLDWANFPDTAPYSGLVDINDDEFTPKLVLEYQQSDNQLWYVSATKGYKSGGFNADSPVVEFQPEKLWSYEIGSKTRFAGGKANFTAAAFYYDYSDIQLRTSYFPPTGGAFVRITNAASAELFGGELALEADLNPHFSVTIGATYLSNSVDGYIPPGEDEEVDVEMPLAPKWDTAIGLNYVNDDISGKITARVEYSYRSEVLFRPTKTPEFEGEDSVGLVNASIQYDINDMWYVALIGRNLTDKTYLSNRWYYPGFSDLETYAPPRRVNFRLGLRF